MLLLALMKVVRWMLLSQSNKRKELESRSTFWSHFEKFYCGIENVQKARCKYCSREIKADPRMHGTKPLKNHYNSCKRRLHEVTTSQARLAFQPRHAGDSEASLVNWKFDGEKIREALCAMLITDELPFKTVEHQGFKHFMSVGCPMFTIPCRRTITKDIFKLYTNERIKFKSFMRENCQRMCITTDTWTSIQKVNYMCLTAHFIDDNWKLHKRILNFCLIIGHKSEEIGKGVEKCLRDWAIDKVFTITIDNASSNDGAITYLNKKFDQWSTNILGGKYVHMRCVAHIINLVVQDGLKGKDEHVAIHRIRNAVRYIRNSPARYKRFEECTQLEKLETKKLLCLDVPTRWNSTYLMLDAAINLKRTFEAFEDMDPYYKKDLSTAPFDGVPNENDWNRVRLLLKFLGHFYDLTMRVSGSLYVTSNYVFHEISSVDMLLKQWMSSDDFELSMMAERMKEKFDKYWGSVDKMNKILYYAVILDPRHKLDFVEWSFDEMYSDNLNLSECMKRNVKEGLKELFDDYKVRYEPPITRENLDSSSGASSDIFSSSSVAKVNDKSYLKSKYKKFKVGRLGDQVKSELDKYLGEDVEPGGDEEEDEKGRKKFDILLWWKINAQRFPILSRVARDIFAVPVSTVTSEAGFSTGGRALDAFRSSLSPKIVQALVCAQDWLRSSSQPICVEEDLIEIETLEKELTGIGGESSFVDNM